MVKKSKNDSDSKIDNKLSKEDVRKEYSGEKLGEYLDNGYSKKDLIETISGNLEADGYSVDKNELSNWLDEWIDWGNDDFDNDYEFDKWEDNNFDYDNDYALDKMNEEDVPWWEKDKYPVEPDLSKGGVAYKAQQGKELVNEEWAKGKTWNKILKVNDEVELSDFPEKGKLKITGFWKNGKLVDNDTATEMKMNQDFRGIQVVDKDGHKYNVNAMQLK